MEAGSTGLQDFLGWPGLLLRYSSESPFGPGISALGVLELATYFSDVQVWGSGLPPETMPGAGGQALLPDLARTGCSIVLRGSQPLVRAGQQSAAANLPSPCRRSMPLSPPPPPPTNWVLVVPVCGAYAWLAAACLLFIRLFPLNFCSRLAHLAPWYLSFSRAPPCDTAFLPRSPPPPLPSWGLALIQSGPPPEPLTLDLGAVSCVGVPAVFWPPLGREVEIGDRG